MRTFAIVLGTKRTVTKFLWIPVTINGETRWLEEATLEQERVSSLSPDCYAEYWKDIAFINQ